MRNAVRQITESTTFDREADVIVVGSGAAGFSAAIHAAAEDAETVLLEKGTRIGGTTFKSHGWMWIPNNSFLRESGVADERDDALRYMARLARPNHYDGDSPTLGLPDWEYRMLSAFYDNGADTIDSLIEKGVRLQHTDGFADYNMLPQNKTPYGRVISPQIPGGELGFGDDLIANMQEVAEGLGVAVVTETAVAGALVNAEGDVVGVFVDTPAGTQNMRARRGVIFGSGGFGNNEEMTENFLMGPVYGSCSAITNTGDFVPIAAQLGAELKNMNSGWFAPCVLEKWLNRGDDPDYASMFSPPGDSMIFVNKYGRRSMNEHGTYHSMAQRFWELDAVAGDYPNLFQFMLWDQPTQEFGAHFIERAENPIVPEGADDRHVIKIDSLDQVGSAIRERLGTLVEHTGHFQLDDSFEANLTETIARYNRFAEAGVDDDFKRGENPVETAMHSHQHGSLRNPASPHMYPIADSGPYYVTIVTPGTLDTRGGPAVSADAEVLDADELPIPGLYGAGNCIATGGKAYWGAGATLGPAVTFGRLAGRAAAKAPERSLDLGVVA